jgi:hypothetical protein
VQEFQSIIVPNQPTRQALQARVAGASPPARLAVMSAFVRAVIRDQDQVDPGIERGDAGLLP